MSTQTSPRVSIGLPVFNGENFISAAIASILAQTFRDFELIISDNASTDGTETICRRYAIHDCRIRYYRSDRNLGAAANFNRTFELASATFFKWAAHDDMLAPEYLEKCVTALESQRDAVLCYPFVKEIDKSGHDVAVVRSGFHRAGCHRASKRFASVLFDESNWSEIFGLARTEALRRTVLHQSYEAEDLALLAELALLGPFVEVPEPLFLHRDHPARFANAVRFPGEGSLTPYDGEKCLSWYRPDSARQHAPHTWLRFAAYRRSVQRHASETGERLRCYGHLLRWASRGMPARLLGIEAAAAIDPRVVMAVRIVKRRVLGGAWQAIPVKPRRMLMQLAVSGNPRRSSFQSGGLRKARCGRSADRSQALASQFRMRGRD